MQGRCKDLRNDNTYQELSKQIDNQHLLKKVNGRIDLRFIDELTSEYYCPNKGREALPPQQYF